MKKFKMLILIAVLTLTCLVSPNASASAANNGGITIEPNWNNADYVSVSLTFSGTTANCVASVRGKPGTTKIVATIKLEQVNVSPSPATWPKTVNSDILDFSGTYSSVSKGNTYRLTITADVTRNGTVETVSGWAEKTYN